MDYPATVTTDRIVCRCLHIAESEVVTAIRALELQTVADLCRRTDAGNGCTACHCELKRLLEQHSYASSSASPICASK